MLSWVAFVAAAAFFWGGLEAFVNFRWPPKGTWHPDLWLPSTYDRVIFYAAAVGLVAVVVWGVKALVVLIRRRRPAVAKRNWSSAAAAAAIIAANAGWLVLGLAGDYEVHLGPLALDVQETAPFFTYWGIFALAGAAAAVGLAFALGKRLGPKKVGRYVRAAGAVLFLAVVVAYHGSRTLRPRPDGPNVIIIILDAWRADAFGPELMPKIYGHARANALVFERAWTCGSWTLPAMGTAFTGQYPDTHRMRYDADSDVVRPTLAQALREAGYDTVGFSANRILNRDHAITDGFDEFYFSSWKPALYAIRFYYTNWYGPAARGLLEGDPTSEDNRVLTRKLSSFLERRHARPYFLWVHYIDPHGPYLPPPGYYRPEDEPYMVDYRPLIRKRGDIYKRLYDGECRFMDDLLSPLLPRLAAEPRTITFVTSDHGEEFWEHGKYSFGHGKTAYENLMRIPFFAYVPGAEAATVETPISLVDLAPTILTLTGQGRLATMPGEVFLTADGDVIEEDKLIFMGSCNFQNPEGKPERRDAVVMWPRKLILPHERMNGGGKYYDLEADPGETKNLEADETKRRLRRALKEWKKASRCGPTDDGYGGAAAPDLRALGYIQ